MSGKHSVRTQVTFDALEQRQLMSSTIEAADGSGNNLAYSSWGSSGTDLIRLTAAAYADGISSPSLTSDLSARAISNLVNNQAVSSTDNTDIATVDGNSLSDFGYAFGQFMDHDMDLTPDGGASFPITVAADDSIGPNSLPFTRSITDAATGTSNSNPAQQVTTVTAYLDLSQVYGSSQIVANALRSFQNGLLKTSPGNMLPYDNATYFTVAQITALNMANDSGAAPTADLFATGDRRGNENVELTALQTLFLRNHNKIATALKSSHADWSDEQLYQEARKINIAEYQSIVYNEWIPAVMGGSALTRYSGYRANVNASISNEFSTVAFRFGHSLLSADIERHNNDGSDIADATGDADISLAVDFFDPYLLSSTSSVDPLTGHTSSNIGPILKAEADGVSQATDVMAVNDVRNLLFGNGGFGGEDLIARDIQRDRDNGIADYNSLRISLGLPAITSFSQITKNPTVQAQLAAAYPGGVNTIDAFEGGIAEDHVRGSDVGPLFQRIMADQFTRLRDGDRFFYLNENLNSQELSFINRSNTLTQVMEANTDLTNLQADAFIFNASISGSIVPPKGVRGVQFLNGLTVTLQNSDGVIVARTALDPMGHYTFDQLSGPSSVATVGSGLSAIGTYSVTLRSPVGTPLFSSAAITFRRSDTHFSSVNLNLSSPPVLPPPNAAAVNPSLTLNSFDVLDRLLTV